MIHRQSKPRTTQEAEVRDPSDEYTNGNTTEPTPVANNPRPDQRHIFKKTGTRQTVTDTRGRQLDKQQLPEYRVIGNGAGNTATPAKIHRSETRNS
jgi:hypothetical protein